MEILVFPFHPTAKRALDERLTNGLSDGLTPSTELASAAAAGILPAPNQTFIMLNKRKYLTLLSAIGALAASATHSQAGSYAINFDEPSIPAPGYTLYGNAVVEALGGVGDTTCAKLTKAINGQGGSLILNELDPGASVSEFTATFKLRMGGGTPVPADGCAFSFAPDIVAGVFGEAGSGKGLTIGFDTYDNVDANPNNGTGEAPRFNVFWNGTLVASSPLQSLATMVSDTYVEAMVKINSNRKLDFTWGGVPIFTDLAIGWQPITGGKFGWGGRTGGANANHFVDDIAISTTTVTLPAPPAATVFYDFNTATVPAGTNAYGNATIVATGGVGNTAFMQLTDAVNGQAGTWTVNDLNAGGPVESIDMSFKLFLSNGTNPPADGFGFHWAPDLPAAGFPNAEEAVGHGLSIGFDVYDNGGGEAPALDVFWLGNKVGGVKVPQSFLNTQGAFVNTRIRLTAQGLIDVQFGNAIVIYHLQVPNWTAFSGAKYGFAARTGGLNQRQAIDDVAITAVPYAGPIGFITQPIAQKVVINGTVTYVVETNDASASQFQWQKLAPGGSIWENIGGATGASYTTPAATFADDGTQFRAHVTSTRNGSQADSNAVTLIVRNIARPGLAQVNDTFDGGAIANTGTANPAQTLSGNYSLPTSGGTLASGSLILTPAAASQFGTLVIGDFNGGAGLAGFTAAVNFDINGANPADGWSLSFGRNIAATQAYSAVENGLGDDLKVGLIYYSGSGVGVLVNWKGTQLVKVPTTLGLMQTSPGVYKEAIVRLTSAPPYPSTATLDVAIGGSVVIDGLPIPDYAPVGGASFALGARTGGAWQLHQFDDLAIDTIQAAPPAISVIQSLDDLEQRITFQGKLSVSTDLVNWTDIPDASPYVVPLGLLPDRQYYRAHW